jgi:hypothetical protein
MDFDETDQLLIIYSVFCQIVEKQWEYNGKVNQLFMDFMKAYDSVRIEIRHNILI